mmetsp:Transcript_9795/g.36870  ORF Transcript_9795/g.36870 Transcript_9795/m.36870 type:complete len:205 (+) Transcript_9795:2272-2886(+)
MLCLRDSCLSSSKLGQKPIHESRVSLAGDSLAGLVSACWKENQERFFPRFPGEEGCREVLLLRPGWILALVIGWTTFSKLLWRSSEAFCGKSRSTQKSNIREQVSPILPSALPRTRKASGPRMRSWRSSTESWSSSTGMRCIASRILALSGAMLDLRLVLSCLSMRCPRPKPRMYAMMRDPMAIKTMDARAASSAVMLPVSVKV